ncbi:hypothetical protein PanWU01x14_051320 [Parasponia andersonii]|uniref:Uncharacterized protein n=1 Tax=Parasponia andersonii TaxID=3476 RepID=A0A2P5DLY5_PARAD|nr:hypothetical protein PanWU01x14_051320 [Parasponia andersonii]
MTRAQLVNQYLIYGIYSGVYYEDDLLVKMITQTRGVFSMTAVVMTGSLISGFILNVGLGSAAGLLVLYLMLGLNKSWRDAYCRLVDNVVVERIP